MCNFQVQQVADFTQALADNSVRREHGVDSHGSTKGCSNSELLRMMPHLQKVGDLRQFASSPTPRVVEDMLDSVLQLEGTMIPKYRGSIGLRQAMYAAHKVLRSEWEEQPSTGNQDLFKRL